MTYRDEFDRIVREYGPWTADNFVLPDGTLTRPGMAPDADPRVDLVLDTASRLIPRPLSSLRILDVGCCEGGIAIGLARAGAAEVVGVDVREAHVEKARFVAQALGVMNTRFERVDMLHLNDAGLGIFDLVVCAGVRYHVDAPDIAPFLQALRHHCRGTLFLDTHIAMRPIEQFGDATPMLGCSFVEHEGDGPDVKIARRWSSATNDMSFWLTERSLANALLDAGFEGVCRLLDPRVEYPWQDRGIWVAVTPIGTDGPEVRGPGVRFPDPDTRAVESPAILASRARGITATSTRPLESPSELGWLALPPGSSDDIVVKPLPYLPIYERALAHLQDREFTLMEVGIWKGDSLKMWRHAFPKATIIGVDLQEPEGFEPIPGVSIVTGDQSDPELFLRIRHELAPHGFDVVIDDASHSAGPTAAMLQAVFPGHLVPGGLYFIEDWGTGYWPDWPDGDVPSSPITLEPPRGGDDADWAGHGLGMVGLVKALVDHVGGHPDTPAEIHAGALQIESMEVNPGVTILRKRG